MLCINIYVSVHVKILVLQDNPKYHQSSMWKSVQKMSSRGRHLKSLVSCMCLIVLSCELIIYLFTLFKSAALIVRFLTKRFIGDYEANTGKYRTHSNTCTLKFNSVMCHINEGKPHCCFSLGALYSRKINIDGEQVSLQVQDTPCVSLQVFQRIMRSVPCLAP